MFSAAVEFSYSRYVTESHTLVSTDQTSTPPLSNALPWKPNRPTCLQYSTSTECAVAREILRQNENLRGIRTLVAMLLFQIIVPREVKIQNIRRPAG